MVGHSIWFHKIYWSGSQDNIFGELLKARHHQHVRNDNLRLAADPSGCRAAALSSGTGLVLVPSHIHPPGKGAKKEGLLQLWRGVVSGDDVASHAIELNLGVMEYMDCKK